MSQYCALLTNEFSKMHHLMNTCASLLPGTNQVITDQHITAFENAAAEFEAAKKELPAIYLTHIRALLTKFIQTFPDGSRFRNNTNFINNFIDSCHIDDDLKVKLNMMIHMPEDQWQYLPTFITHTLKPLILSRSITKITHLEEAEQIDISASTRNLYFHKLRHITDAFYELNTSRPMRTIHAPALETANQITLENSNLKADKLHTANRIYIYTKPDIIFLPVLQKIAQYSELHAKEISLPSLTEIGEQLTLNAQKCSLDSIQHVTARINFYDTETVLLPKLITATDMNFDYNTTTISAPELTTVNDMDIVCVKNIDDFHKFFPKLRQAKKLIVRSHSLKNELEKLGLQIDEIAVAHQID
ncbi:MAG TPA: hypothetical protein VD999_00245 [Vitreimonas sp.]|nr:hypothetical protein [Vitreimonas sp.]